MDKESIQVKASIVESETFTPEQSEELLRKFVNCNSCLNLETYYDEIGEYIGFGIIGNYRTLRIDSHNKILDSMLMRIVEEEIIRRKEKNKELHNQQCESEEFFISSNSIHTHGPELEVSARHAKISLSDTSGKVKMLGGYEIKIND